MPHLSHEKQQRITRLCVRCGLLLMQYGAESTVVVDLTRRLGLALGVEGVECALSFNALTLTTLKDGRCITTTRHTIHQSINARVLVQIGHIVRHAEQNARRETLLGDVQQKLDALNKKNYPKPIVVVFVGLSCASFAHLNGADWTGFTIAFVAASSAMATRLFLLERHFNAFIATIAAAFVATLLAAWASWLGASDHAEVAIASSVLLLVPSFPLINALSDILKGYINMGVGRFVWASMLSLSACVGIVIALLCFNIGNWGL